MLSNQTASVSWNEVLYPSPTPTPIARWGHRLLRVSPSLLLLFGGFGSPSSEGHYLGDLWLFDTVAHSWQSLPTSGDLPSARSNYTLHLSPTTNEVLLFGGGADSKQRFNGVHTLNLETLVWKQHLPRPDCPAPWQRTYHVAEYLHPYLIVYSGQGVAATDLDDLWAYDTRNHEWTCLHPSGTKPNKRRFAASALIGNQLYVVGGCHGNYTLLGDIIRMDLQPLLQGRPADLQWECLVPNDRLLERWGHSCDVFEGKLYMWAGRISANSDNQDLLEFDPHSGSLRQLRQLNPPKARRRHATALIGHSLIVFGGYNGKYLKDCHYVNLPEMAYSPNTTPALIASNQQELLRKVSEHERLISPDLTLAVWKEGKLLGKVGSNKEKLTGSSLFFKHLLSSEAGREDRDELRVELPQGSSLLSFRCAHLAAVQGYLFVDCTPTLKLSIALAHTLEYFSLHALLESLQKYLHSQLSSLNCHQLLDCAIHLQLPTLTRHAAALSLKIPENPTPEEETPLESHCQLNPTQPHSTWLAARRYSILSSTMQNLRFDIEQTRIREGQTGFLSRTARKIKSIFSSQDSNPDSPAPPPPKSAPHKPSCLSKLLAFVSSLCTSHPE